MPEARRAIILTMATKIGTKAATPNPALKPFEVLVGEWQTVGSHPYLPGVVLHGRTSFDWVEGGAFLIMHSEIEESHFPDGVAILASDDVAKRFVMLSFDQRGVSRFYEATMAGNELRWWRDEPSFSQRVVITIQEDGNAMISTGEMSRDGGAWEKDLELTYTRIR